MEHGKDFTILETASTTEQNASPSTTPESTTLTDEDREFFATLPGFVNPPKVEPKTARGWD